MFGSAPQKPGGFSFGATPGTATGINNNQTNTFGFGNNNSNTTPATTTSTQPSGFTFGNNSTTSQSALGTGNSFKGGIGGGLFNKPATSTTSGGLNFGANSNTGTKPALFGNSSTNPTFGGASSGLGFAQNTLQPSQQQQQQQQQQGMTSLFSNDLNKLNDMEMPKSLTNAPSDDMNLKLKRKRTNSGSKPNEHKNEPSLVGKLVETFKTPSKYSIENFRGLFTNDNIHKNNTVNTKTGKGINEQIKEYSSKLGLDSPQLPASKSEYRRLIIRNPNDTFKKYNEIDADAVLLSKIKNPNQFRNMNNSNKKTSEPVIIESLKPKSKRVKKSDDINDENIELTFSKPISEQLSKKAAEWTESENTDADYWCIPSIEELSKKTSLELTHVENFIVGRKGHGNLMYKYPVDLSAFEGKWDQLLGKTIIIGNKLLQVYSDEYEKPSQGNGLNIPAVITLEKTFPSKYDPLNPDVELLEKHIEKLKSVHGMKFISFDPLTGNYVFEVEHFSIWGIVDEDEHDEELIAKWKKQQENEYQNEKRRNELQINALEKIAGYGQPGDNWKRQKTDLGVVNPGEFLLNDEDEDEEGNDSEIKNNELLLDTNKNDDGEDDDVLVDASVPSSLDDDENVDAKALALINRNYDGIEDLVEVRAYEPEVKEVMNLQFLKSRAELSVSDNWDEQLALSKGFFSVFNKNLDKKYDMKVDPKNVDKLIFGNKDTSKLVKAIIEPPLQFNNSNEYGKCLRSEVSTRKVEIRTNGLPEVKVDSSISLRIPLLSFDSCEDYNLWELLSILYDSNFLESFMSEQVYRACDNDTNSIKFKHISEIKKRELLCQFLQKINSMGSSALDFNESPTDSLERIFHFVCTDKISDAIQYAINTKNNHIAVLLTMIDSNDAMVHELACGQLKEWSNGTIAFIPSGVLKIYKLLSGDILGKEYIDHLDGLSWPIILFLLVKYGNTTKSVDEIIEQFIDYFEQNGLVDTTNNQIYYLLFKMIHSSSTVLPQFDIELQFLIMKYLNTVIDFNEVYFDEIVEKFAKKLEKKDMIEESIFILEHHTNEKRSNELITDLLYNNVKKLGFLEDNQRLNELHHRLHLPMKILHEARSFEFNNLEQYYMSVLELILANNLKSGHKILLEHVAPEIVISNNNTKLEKLDSLISEFESLSEYKTGAEVYKDYITVTKIAKELDFDDISYKEKCEELKAKIGGVLNGISVLEDSNSKVKIAKTLMMKKLINVTFKENLQFTSAQLSCIELPESERNYLESKFETDDVKMISN